jgi:hypothetical protein
VYLQHPTQVLCPPFHSSPNEWRCSSSSFARPRLHAILLTHKPDKPPKPNQFYQRSHLSNDFINLHLVSFLLFSNLQPFNGWRARALPGPKHDGTPCTKQPRLKTNPHWSSFEPQSPTFFFNAQTQSLFCPQARTELQRKLSIPPNVPQRCA